MQCFCPEKSEFTMRKLTSLICLLFIVLSPETLLSSDFSFALIADPHIDNDPAHQKNLNKAVDWIIENKSRTGIQLVFVLGDIGWSGTHKNPNLLKAKKILDRLQQNKILYCPVIGDNEIQTYN